MKNCPFYGRHMILIAQGSVSLMPLRLILLDSGGNQCAITMDGYAPCLLEIEGKPVEWSACKRVQELTPRSTG